MIKSRNLEHRTARYNGILSVAQNALHFGLGGVLDGFLDLVHRGTLSQTACQIDNRNIWSWDTESHTGEFAIQIRNNLKKIGILAAIIFEFKSYLSDGFGGASRSRDDVLTSTTAISPCLGGGTVDSLLSGGVSVDSGHESFFDSESIIDDLEVRLELLSV